MGFKLKIGPSQGLKLKGQVGFSLPMIGGAGLKATKTGGVWYIDYDYDELPPGPVTNSTTAMVAVLDQSAGIYKEVSLASLLASGLDADLQVIAALTGQGILARTADDTWALRALTGTANEVTVTNGDGVAGNPTVSLPDALTFTGKTVTGGTYANAAAVTITNDAASLILNSTGGQTDASVNLAKNGSPRWAYGINVGVSNENINFYTYGAPGVALALDYASGAVSAPFGLTTPTVNGNTLTAGTYTLTGAAGKTLAFDNSLELAGTDGTKITFQGTDTYVGRATTDTLTNKSIDANQLTGTLQAAQFPALTGDVTTAAGGLGTTIGAGKVTSAMLNADVFSTAHSWSGVQTFTAPALGTPASVTLTNATGLPIASGVSGLATGVATFLAAPSSANLKAALTDETGSGAAVFGTSPNITTPTGIVKSDVGLGNVDNTSDATKWGAVKTLTNTTYDTAGTGNSFSINGLAATSNTGTGAVVRGASPALTGIPTAPTASPSNNSTQLATTAYVDAQVAGSVAGVASLNGQTGALVFVAPPQGRLTLATGTPVMIAAQSAKTTLYYTPYVGNQIPIYDGANMVPTTFAELSIATTDTTHNPAAIGAGKVNDWFVWNDGGTIRLSHGPDWTNDTTRSAGTALVRVNGIWLNNAAITNGPAASRGTYVGTTRSDASSQLNWILGGATGGGVAAFLGAWNAYNRVQVVATVSDTTSLWSYSSATIRPFNNSTSNRISYVCGLTEDMQFASLFVTGRMVAAGGYMDLGWALNATNARNSPLLEIYAGTYAASIQTTLSGSMTPGLGFNYLQVTEAGDGTNANQLVGSGIANAFTMNWRM